MLDAYIIDKLKKEREKKEEQVWQPTPLPLEYPNFEEIEEREPKMQEKKKAEITFQF